MSEDRSWLRGVSRFNHNIGVLRGALETVASSPAGRIRWTPLVTSLYKLDSTPWRVHTMICWLTAEGYLRRPSRGTYSLTERGEKLREALTKASDARVRG